MEQTVYWYSRTEMGLVNLEPSAEELKGICNIKGCIPSVAKAIRANALQLIPVLPIWVYGTLMEGESAHHKIANLALPEFKPLKGIQTGIRCYTNDQVPFPAAKLESGATLYMERYLIPLSGLDLLNHYEGAPDLYTLQEMPNIEGFFYHWCKGLESWKPLQGEDWRLAKKS